MTKPKYTHADFKKLMLQRDAYKSLVKVSEDLIKQSKDFVCSFLGYKDVDYEDTTYLSLVVDICQRLKKANEEIAALKERLNKMYVENARLVESLPDDD